MLKYQPCADTPIRFSEQIVREMVDLFCIRDPGELTITTMPSSKNKPNMRGLFLGGQIFLFDRAIKTSVGSRTPLGGNHTVASSVELGYAYVLRHELQHLNQSMLSGGTFEGSSMFHGKYLGRPGEVDARGSVDRDQEQIDALFGVERIVNVVQQETVVDSIDDVIEFLAGAGTEAELSKRDVRDELRHRGFCAPHNLSMVVSELISRGVRVS